MKKFLIISIIVFAGCSSYASPNTCIGVFENQISLPQALDPIYREIKDQPENEKGPKITKMLNELFTPLMVQFKSKVDRVSDQQIKKMVNALENRYSIKDEKNLTPENDWFPEPEPYSSSWAQKSHRQSVMGFEEQYASDPHFAKAAGMKWIKADLKSSKILGGSHELMSMVITPVGDYGPEFAENMLRTTQILIKIAKSELVPASAQSYVSNPELLEGETARTMLSIMEETNAQNGPLNAMVEGIQSLNQLITNVLGEKTAGLSTGSEALHALIFESKSKVGLISEITARLPMGLNGPASLSGYHLKNVFERDGENHLVLTSEIVDFLKKKKTSRQRRVCPMARYFHGDSITQLQQTQQKTGLQDLGEMYWRIFKLVEGQRKSGASQTN